MLVTLRVWFTSFQGVIDDQDTSVKRYGYLFYKLFSIGFSITLFPKTYN